LALGMTRQAFRISGFEAIWIYRLIQLRSRRDLGEKEKQKDGVKTPYDCRNHITAPILRQGDGSPMEMEWSHGHGNWRFWGIINRTPHQKVKENKREGDQKGFYHLDSRNLLGASLLLWFSMMTNFRWRILCLYL
jgi:hypothetical protein